MVKPKGKEKRVARPSPSFELPDPFRQALAIADPREGLRDLAAVDLREFVEQAWPIVVPAEQFQSNWHIDAICEHLTAVARGQILDLLINIPPRTGKSTIVSVMFPAWLWIRDPTLRFLYASYAQDLSTRDSVRTRWLIESAWYRGNWGDRFKLVSDQNQKTRFENDKRGYRLATAVRGANTGEGGDLIIVDDPHNVLEGESDVVRSETVRWWNEVMPTRTGRLPRRRIVIMQRVHEEDVAGDILEKNKLSGEWTHLNLPMEFESKFKCVTKIGWEDPRKEEGELLWPQRQTAQMVASLKKDLGTYGAAAQLQQRPAPLEGGMFKRSNWKFYRPDPIIVEKLLQEAEDSCMSWDCAFKDLETSKTGDPDFVVGQAWVRIGGNFYLLWQIRDRMGFAATKRAVMLLASKFPKIVRKLVEDKANGTAVVEDLKHTLPGVIPVEPHGGKEARASVVEPIQEAQQIWLPEGYSWVEDYIEEFRVFPNGAHDDQVDATSQAIVWLMERYNKRSAADVQSFTKTTNRLLGQDVPYYDPRYS